MDQQRIIQKLHEIEQIAASRVASGTLPQSLCCGMAGTALFYSTLYETSGEEKYLDKTYEIIEYVVNNARFYEKLFSHCGGLAGITWLVGYYIEKGYIDKEAYEAFSYAEVFLHHKMTELLSGGYYDFLHDGLGVFYSFLVNEPASFNRQDIIREVVTLLDACSIKEDGLIRWANVDYKERTLVPRTANLGLSHGLPSIMAMLAKAYPLCTEEPVRAKIRELAEGAARFIYAYKSKGDTMSLYPYGINLDDAEHTYISRLAWCYGDLGIAIGFWSLYKAFDDTHWRDAALEIMDRSALRRDVDGNRVYDSGFCHGSGGVSHIFRRFYWETGNPRYLETAEYWLDIVLKQAYFKDGDAGYKYTHGELGFVNNYDLLDGLIGTGIVLATALSDKPLTWDRAWLVS